MKKIIKRTLVSFLIFTFSLAPISPQALLNSSQAEDIISISGDYETDFTINDKWTVIKKGTTVTIKNGADLIFAEANSHLSVEGKLIIEGTKLNPSIIKGNSEHGGYAIRVESGAEVNVKNAEIIEGGYSLAMYKGLTTKILASARTYHGAIDIGGGKTAIEYTTFEDNEIAVIADEYINDPSYSLKVNYSKFIDNEYDVEASKKEDFTNNYWDSFVDDMNACTIAHTPNSCLSKAYGDFEIYPWQEEEDFDAISGASSVLFLPGIQASRLYKEHLLDEDKLWEPTNRNEDVKDLYMNSDGTSADKNIYTKDEDIIDKAYSKIVYEDFISYMDSLVTDKTIKEWKPFSYDWRLPLEDIANNKIKFKGTDDLDIIEEVDRLARESNTGKVTIIGHSNGGLLGKLLIDKLKSEGKENLVDKFIMVATPQVGTPKAIAGLLHGSQLSFPFLLNEKTGRGLAENMSSAYNLLPSKKYFTYVQTPVVEFEDDVKDIYDFKELYGDEIGSEDETDSKEELDKFLTGDDGKRSDPDFDDTDSLNVLSKNLLSKANNLHDNHLDNWSAPDNVEVIQIAGWGLDTIAGIKYDDCDIVFCPDELSNLDRELVLKKDGDATVVIPSAIIMNDGEIYYVNIEDYANINEENIEHSNMLEIPQLQEFIKNILNNNRNLPPYITTLKPEVADADDSLRYRMHSPVEVHLSDGANHTGITNNPDPASDLIYYEENIPNSYYLEFGETKYLGSPKDENIRVELIGEDTGTFTFEIDELSGDDVDKTTVFKDVPVVKDMRANIDISENIGIMNIDWNNDEKVDITINTEEANSVPKASLEILEEIIKSSKINPILKNLFLNELMVAQKQIAKGKNKVAGQILEILEKQIETFSDKKMLKKLRIDKAEAEKLIKIIETIRLSLIN